MSDDPQDDSVLYPPDTRAQSNETTEPLTPEEQALLDDLNVYDNPEVFHDSSLPQIYKLHIRTAHLPDVPYILDIEINGGALPAALRESALAFMARDPSFSDTDNIDDVRKEMLADPEYLNFDLNSRRFFVRQFPKLMVHIYNILIILALSSATRRLVPNEPSETEKVLKLGLRRMLQGLEREIKRMLETRSSGRPKKEEQADIDIVNEVLNIAEALMGDARGLDAVPGLKEIAARIDPKLTEGALGKRLKRAGYLWSDIKTHLANREPPSDKN